MHQEMTQPWPTGAAESIAVESKSQLVDYEEALL